VYGYCYKPGEVAGVRSESPTIDVIDDVIVWSGGVKEAEESEGEWDRTILKNIEEDIKLEKLMPPIYVSHLCQIADVWQNSHKGK